MKKLFSIIGLFFIFVMFNCLSGLEKIEPANHLGWQIQPTRSFSCIEIISSRFETIHNNIQDKNNSYNPTNHNGVSHSFLYDYISSLTSNVRNIIFFENSPLLLSRLVFSIATRAP